MEMPVLPRQDANLVTKVNFAQATVPTGELYFAGRTFHFVYLDRQAMGRFVARSDAFAKLRRCVAMSRLRGITTLSFRSHFKDPASRRRYFFPSDQSDQAVHECLCKLYTIYWPAHLVATDSYFLAQDARGVTPVELSRSLARFCPPRAKV